MFHKVLTRSLLAAAVLLAPVTVAGVDKSAHAAGSAIKVTLDGKTLSLGSGPQISKGRTLIPYSGIVSALGGKASWDASSKTVTATKDSTTVKLTVGSHSAYINGQYTYLDSAPYISDGKTFVPLRLVSEAFGKWVNFNSAASTVAISSTLTVSTSTGSFTLKKKPSRIVTLSSSDTEIIYALGGKVVGRSTAIGPVIPAAASSVPEVGSTHGINFETLASVKPDLVIASPSLKSQQATIEKLGAQVLFNSHNTFTEIQASIRLYGKVLSQETKAEQIIKGMKSDIASLKKPATAPKTLIVYGAPGSFVVALPTSYPGNFLELAGGKNVAANFPKMDMMPQYADLSLERIIAANPDLILMITHGDAAEVKASFKKQFETNPAWKSLSAVKNDRFEVLPSDLFAANPGIRAPQAIETINKLLLQVK
ncbi:ABC transporter substrate-binding protein [Paenibacillus sp. OV219]|uniref:ABC transporter substrate-binding protein n=1 Tax=Paenibacillus sp. OV219 TaxID=1884377 RepID=UPI0008BC1DCA|nr:ABC transporter substrate-binding protein [Paenibacillus sp. OV219]SEO67012.1 ABC-type Fe3+-hydroxamate transport system, substrate-binding protein [Paenibacillus sp. OV219]